MKALIIYESLTGTTRRAAGLMAAELSREGVPATACAVDQVDYQSLSEAELVIVGSWTDGFVFVGQRPGRASRLRRLPVMYGKRCAVYCTYAVDPGRTLEKLTRIMQDRGADVIGGMAIRRTKVEEGVVDFVGRVLDAATAGDPT